MAERMGYPISCIGIPKTVDNDLPFTDCCPGFGSVAKYIATSTLEASLDVQSMCDSSTKVFILEVMGRHAGWIAASGGLAGREPGSAPHVIIFPEHPFEREAFLAKVDQSVKDHGFCVVVASEGAQYDDGRFLSEAGPRDVFGHAQLGGVAPTLANMVKQSLGYKNHWAVADYLQRSARHIASQTDLEQAYAVGEAAITYALEGRNGIMPVIKRDSSSPYRWHISEAPLNEVANQEKKMPIHFTTDDGFGITTDCREYLEPLIQGEAYPLRERSSQGGEAEKSPGGEAAENALHALRIISSGLVITAAPRHRAALELLPEFAAPVFLQVFIKRTAGHLHPVEMLLPPIFRDVFRSSHTIVISRHASLSVTRSVSPGGHQHNSRTRRSRQCAHRPQKSAGRSSRDCL